MAKLKNLDIQMPDLPKEIVFCKNCVCSNQRPRTVFNAQGICSACQWAWEKDSVIDWNERERELCDLCDRVRSKDGHFDVLVPGSGGKDSAYVAHQLKERYKMHPLCVTWAPFEWTGIGWKNLMRFVGAGFSNIIAQPNGVFHRKLAAVAFESIGDAWQPFTYGQKAWAFHIAEKFGIKLIFYGENGELEYGGSTKYKYRGKEDPEDWTSHHFRGAEVDKLIEYGLERGIMTKEDIDRDTVTWYKAPPRELIEKLGLEMHWYSYYTKWTPHENFYYAAKYTGFETDDCGRTESTYTKYASLDDRADGFHFYLAYMKFGLGRCSRDAMQDIRRHHITRDEGVALVRKYDHEFPQRHYQWFLKYLGITDEFFWEVMDFYREQSNAWERRGGQWHLKTVVS